MSKRVKVVMDKAGCRELLLSDEVHQLVTEVGEDIKTRANAGLLLESSGYELSVQRKGIAGRWIGFVNSTDDNAALAERQDQILTRTVTGK